MAIDDYYELLDVAPDSERETIRLAYKTQRDELQAQNGDQSRGRIAELNRAWNVLSDPRQRERYDERLAEQREGGDDDEYDDDDDDDTGDNRRGSRPAARPARSRSSGTSRSSKSAPLTKAEQRAEARRLRAEKIPTLAAPEGFTMAPTKPRLQALAFDLLVLSLLFLAVYVGGFKLIDNHFPGERSHGSDLVNAQKQIKANLSANQKLVSDADKAAATAKRKHETTAEAKAKATAARAGVAKDTRENDKLTPEITKIDKQLSPWITLTYVLGTTLMLFYLVPSTAISGQTLGKRVWKVRVVHLDGSRPGLSTAIVRFGVPLLLGLILALPFRFQVYGFAIPVFLMIGWVTKPNRQGLHDKLAKTIVVEA